MTEQRAIPRTPTFSADTRSPFSVTMAWLRRAWPEGADVMQQYILYLRAEAQQSGAIEPRFMPQVARARSKVTYSSVVADLEVTQPEAARVVSEYVRQLRAECADARVKLREAEKDLIYLEGQIDALTGDRDG